MIKTLEIAFEEKTDELRQSRFCPYRSALHMLKHSGSLSSSNHHHKEAANKNGVLFAHDIRFQTAEVRCASSCLHERWAGALLPIKTRLKKKKVRLLIQAP